MNRINNKTNIIGTGAEAIIEKHENSIVKRRISKGYRIKKLDDKIRKTRTRREAKLLKKMGYDIKHEEYTISMEYIDGDKVSEILDSSPLKIAKLIAKAVTKMHDDNIIHSDLTTSNMILKDDKIYLIDFGLGYMSTKVEHKAVDIHLLRQALESKHYKVWKKAYAKFLEEYKPKQKKEILERLKKVENRGRNKSKN